MSPNLKWMILKREQVHGRSRIKCSLRIQEKLQPLIIKDYDQPRCSCEINSINIFSVHVKFRAHKNNNFSREITIKCYLI